MAGDREGCRLRMVPCPFCRIISGELGSAHIGENEQAVAFLDFRPVNRGHTLVVPRHHVPSLADLTDSESLAVFQLIRKIASALKSELPECTGVTVSAADGEIAGQEVPHAHFHVIPRSSGDGFGWSRYGTLTDFEALETTAILIATKLKLADS